MASFVVSRSSSFSHLLLRPISTKLIRCLCTSQLTRDPPPVFAHHLLDLKFLPPPPPMETFFSDSQKLDMTRDWDTIWSVRPHKFDTEVVLNTLQGVFTRPDKAESFFRWLQQSQGPLFEHNRQTYGKMVEIFSANRLFEKATRMLIEMRDDKKGIPLDEDLFVTIIDASAVSLTGNLKHLKVISLFDSMEKDYPGVVRTSKSYASLFRVLMIKGLNQLAETYFDQMLSDGVNPTRQACSAILSGYAWQGRLDAASKFLLKIKEQGLVTSLDDLSAYNNIIDKGRKTLEEKMKKWAEDDKDDDERLFGDVRERDRVDPGDGVYVSCGTLEDGLKLFQDIKSEGIEVPTVSTYCALIHGLCYTKRISEAKAMFIEMVDTHDVPRYRVYIFSRMIKCLCESGDVDFAVHVLRTMDAMDIPARVEHYAVLIDYFCKSGAYDTALEFFNELIDKEIILASYSYLDYIAIADSPIASYFHANGLTEKAEKAKTAFLQLDARFKFLKVQKYAQNST